MMAGRLHRLREWSPLLPLLLLLAGTWWLNQQVQPLPPAADGSKRHDPDFIVSRFSATTLNENGTPHFLMSAEKMVHYPDNDTTYLDEPRLNSLHFQNRISSRNDLSCDIATSEIKFFYRTRKNQMSGLIRTNLQDIGWYLALCVAAEACRQQ